MKKILSSFLVLFALAFSLTAQTPSWQTYSTTLSTNRWFTNGTTSFSTTNAFYADLGQNVTMVQSLYFNPRFVSTNTTTSNFVIRLQSSPDGVVWTSFQNLTGVLASTTITNVSLALFRTNDIPVSANRYIRMSEVVNANGASTNIAVTNLVIYGTRQIP